MLDDDQGRLGKLGRQLISRIGVVEVVVTELLALELLGRRHPRPGRAADVERRLLMRVFAVTQFFLERGGDDQRLGEILARLAREPLRHRRIIGRGAGKGGAGEASAEIEAGRSVMRGHLLQHLVVIRRRRHDRHVGVVLGGGADQRRSADVDIFHALIERRALGHGRGEGIEIHCHQIDGRDAVFPDRIHVRWVAALGQYSAMHRGVQRLDPAVEHFRKLGDRSHLLDREPGLDQRLGRAAGGNQLDAVLGQRLGESYEAALVGNRDQRPLDGAEIGVRHRCPANRGQRDHSADGRGDQPTIPRPRRARASWPI